MNTRAFPPTVHKQKAAYKVCECECVRLYGTGIHQQEMKNTLK